MDGDTLLTALNDIQLGVSMAKNLIPDGKVQDALALESLLAGLITTSLRAYKAQTGQPYDLTQLPEESEV